VLTRASGLLNLRLVIWNLGSVLNIGIGSVFQSLHLPLPTSGVFTFQTLLLNMTRASRRPDRRPRTPGFAVKIQQGGNQVRDGAQGTGIWAKRVYNNLLGRNIRRAIDQDNTNDPAVMTCSSSRKAPFVITHRFTWSGQPVQREIYTNITLSDSRYVPDTDPELEKQLEVARSLGKLHLCCHPLTSPY
jgi:hypothetical protein